MHVTVQLQSTGHLYFLLEHPTVYTGPRACLRTLVFYVLGQGGWGAMRLHCIAACAHMCKRCCAALHDWLGP